MSFRVALCLVTLGSIVAGCGSGVDLLVPDDTTSAVAGRVLDTSDGQPVGGALVTASANSTTTAADGTYALLMANPQGTSGVSIRATRTGFQDYTNELSVIPGQAVRQDLEMTPESGMLVAFTSDATNLAPGNTGGLWHVYLHDRQTGQTERISVTAAGAAGNDSSWDSQVSSGGRYVFFTSLATDLIAGDGNGAVDIFVRDRSAGTTRRVSVGPGGVEGDGDSFFHPSGRPSDRARQKLVDFLVPGGFWE